MHRPGPLTYLARRPITGRWLCKHILLLTTLTYFNVRSLSTIDPPNGFYLWPLLGRVLLISNSTVLCCRTFGFVITIVLSAQNSVTSFGKDIKFSHSEVYVWPWDLRFLGSFRFPRLVMVIVLWYIRSETIQKSAKYVLRFLKKPKYFSYFFFVWQEKSWPYY